MAKLPVNGSFVSEKISKIRWIPEEFNETTSFLTGSWGFNENKISYYDFKYNGCEYEDAELVPKCQHSLPIIGDVNGIEMLNLETAVVSTSDGLVCLFDVDKGRQNLKEKFTFKELHKFNNEELAPLTGISVCDTDIASVGEDGKLVILSSSSQTVVRDIANADSCSLTCVSFINQKEVLTGSQMGVLKMFDVRQKGAKPTLSFMISCEDEKKSNAVTCITYHPTQKHIVLGGSEEGTITVWDLRQPNFPASYLSAHDSPITELAFHRTQPTKLFSACENGDLWQWTQNTMLTGAANNPQMDVHMKFEESEQISPWLNGERTKNKINISVLIGLKKSINSFDTCSSKIICGGDSEAIYLIETVF